MRLSRPALNAWRSDNITDKQKGRIEVMADELDLTMEKVMELAGQPNISIHNLTKGEASDLICTLEDLYDDLESKKQ